MRILVTGAAGAGATTLGSALARQWGCRHLDTDDYFWFPSSPPYQRKRTEATRVRMLTLDLFEAPDAVVSGSMMNWGSRLEDAFDLIVFLRVPTAVRLARLVRRDLERFGKSDPVFLRWASRYEEGPPQGRSYAQHAAWLAQRSAPVLRIEGDSATEASADLVIKAIAAIPTPPSTAASSPPAAASR
ncbi:AAA family ATPase [Ramlibacter sp. WS9]|uniref:AAA family ATPase n=1 Tax=Ramlibacter sp. WS9 TaxID=1882741 RepID=UPI0011414791|nr:AAA family ATPase [Ramlibacter sp. WS9]ROZ74392.1 hypothetical protein EEB15_17815 [Ramlibacter sp. WS9]